MTDQEQMRLLTSKHRELEQKMNDLQPRLSSEMERHREARVRNLITPSEAFAQNEISALQSVQDLTSTETILIGDINSLNTSIDDLRRKIQSNTVAVQQQVKQTAQDTLRERRNQAVDAFRFAVAEMRQIAAIESGLGLAAISSERLIDNYCNEADMTPYTFEARDIYFPPQKGVAA